MEIRVAGVEVERAGALGPPAVLVLDRAAPEEDAAEHARDGVRLVPAAEVRPDRRRLARRVDAARAVARRRTMSPAMFEEDTAARDLVGAAACDELCLERPELVGDDRCEP